MRTLLQQLHQEVFILDCTEELPESVSMSNFECKRVDQHTLEIAVQKGQNINEVFIELDKAGIKVCSMRNRANRLEEMFVNLVEGAA